MSNHQIARPIALDIVPASEVGDLIDATDREFSKLEQEAARASAAAREAEARAAEAGVDPKSSTWTMVRLQRFLDTLHAEARRDAEATIAVAHQQARMRIDDARVRSSRAGQPAPEAFVPATQRRVDRPSPPPADARPPVPVASEPPPKPVAVEPSPPKVGTNGHGPVATVAAPSAQPVRGDDMTVPPVSAPRVVPPVVAAPVVAAPVVAAPVVVPPAATQVVAPPVVTPQAAAPAPPQAQAPAPAVQVAAAPMPKKKGPLRRLPIAAILEVIAVLLVLVFILLRLS
jgi:hypothetical protein